MREAMGGGNQAHVTAKGGLYPLCMYWHEVAFDGNRMQNQHQEGGVARGVLHACCSDCSILQHTMGPAPFMRWRFMLD
jgi:hypothetical protein